MSILRGRFKVHPIIDWTNKDVYEYLTKHNLPYHPLWEKGYVSVGDYNPKGNGFQTRRLGWNQASNTILEKGLMGQTHIHPICDRGFTTQEAIRIMGLPIDFKLEGTLKQKQARIGLMVAPPQLKRIAETIYENNYKQDRYLYL